MGVYISQIQNGRIAVAHTCAVFGGSVPDESDVASMSAGFEALSCRWNTMLSAI